MSPRPTWSKRKGLPAGVRVSASDGTVWFRVRGQRPVLGKLAPFDWWERATRQPPVVSVKAAIGIAIAERETRIAAIISGDSAGGKAHTLRSYAEQLRAEKQDPRPSTVRGFNSRGRTHWFSTLGAYPIDSITPDDIRAWWAGVKAKDLAASTKNLILGDLITVFDSAFHAELTTRNPLKGSGVVRLREPKKQRRKYLDGPALAPAFAHWHATNPHAWFVFTMLVATGMRCGELTGKEHCQKMTDDTGPLRLSDIHGGAIHISEERSKTRKPREIAVSPFVAELLDWWRGFAPEGDQLVVVSRSTLWRQFNKGARVAGLEPGEKADGTVHTLRKVSRSILRTSGVDIVVCDALLGHKTTTATAVREAYAAPFTGEEAEAMHALGEYVRGFCGALAIEPTTHGRDARRGRS